MGEDAFISFIDLNSPAKREVLGNIFDGLKTVFENSRFILGAEVSQFEEKFSAVAGCRYGVGVNSGLDALILTLRAFGVGEGDEVITVPNSYVATAAAIALVGARPVFIDVGTDHNMDPALIEKAITSKTKALIPVHLTGNPCRMDEIMLVARRHNLKVIEDTAQAIGATYKNKPLGSFGDAGCFSLHPLKNLHVWGDGGMISTNDKELSERLKMQRNHGHKNRDEVEFYSFNSRLDTVHAVVGLEYLNLLDSTIAKRIANAEMYDHAFSRLTEFVSVPEVDRKNVRHVFHLYVIRAKNRDGLAKHLLENGIETKVHYPIPIHLQKASVYLGYQRGDFPMTEELSSQMLSLPVRENLSESDIKRVCRTVESFYRDL